ncbi:S8 family peptidase, partial [Candidatus Nomurabacteria bacterium]|nr:S8 family peptidase [Candidatus Nomurabacteria bacterium]
GTPVAAAHVAGVASLLLAQDPSRTPPQIKSILESTAEDQVGDPAEDTPGWDQYYGHGRINAYYALGGQVGLREPARTEESISVFPNPAMKEFNVSFPGDAQIIQLVNSIGQVIDTKHLNQQTSTNLKVDEAGIFLVRMIMSNGLIVTKKIMIND